MSVIALALGLIISGGLGFLLGAKPSLISKRSNAQETMELLYPLAVAFFVGFVFSTLVPHALTHSIGSILAYVLGIATMAGLSKWVFKRDPCCEVGHDHAGFGAMSLIAMSICSINDGLLIGLLEPHWLSGLNLGMILHKVTSSFAIAQIMRNSQFKGWRLTLFGLAYTLISPMALLAVRMPGLGELMASEGLLAFSAGLLSFVTLANLVPQARKIIKRRPRTLWGFILGFLISLGVGFWHTSMHEKHGHESKIHAGPDLD